MPTKRYRLGNGLTVLLHRMPEAPAVSVWTGYKVGSRRERPGMTGATHWVEHMLFKGGGKLKVGEIDQIVGRLGGKFNGFTDTDFTAYFETLPPDSLDTALMIEAERMRNAAFDLKEMEAERGVVISEREGAENDPKYQLHEQLWHIAFHIHPYHHPVVGWKQDLQRMQRDELYAYYRTHYAPNNAVLAVAGNFRERDVRERVRMRFGGFSREDTPPPPDVVEPPQHGERRGSLHKRGTQDHLLVGYRVPPVGHEDTAALLVAQAILSGWKGFSIFGSGYTYRSNRLYRALVDARLATDASAGHAMRADPGLFLADATVREGVKPATVERVLLKTVESLATRGPTKAETDRARRQMRVWSAYDLDGPTSAGLLLTFFEVLGGHELRTELAERYMRVTARDVQRVAETYFRGEGRTVCTFHARREAS